jgi:cytochrome c5
VQVPPDYAAEMVPFDPLVGEFRVHYAGFFDPGFGYAGAGGKGSRAVLEVRSREVPFILEHGQIVGRLVYEKWCTPCHGSGEGKPGTIAAAALYKGSKPAVLTERTDLTPAAIKTAVRSGVFVMPRFRKTEVTDAELEAIVTYLTRKPEPKR